MKRLSLGALAVAGVLAAVMPGTASATADPGCYGQFVAFFAQNPESTVAPSTNVGEWVSGQAVVEPGVIGHGVVPNLKTLACG